MLRCAAIKALRRAKIILGSVLLIGLCSATMHAQLSACQARAVVVNVRNNHGNFVSGLRVENFKVRVHGSATKVLSANTGTPMHRVVVLLDLSGSMGYEDKIKSSRFTAGELVHSLSGDPQFALILFADQVMNPVPFGHSQREVLSAIDSATSSPHVGKTILWDALWQASRLFGTPQDGDAIVVATDGGENGSQVSLHVLRNELLSRGVRVFFLNVGQEKFFRTEEESMGSNSLISLSESTGGAAVEVADNDDIQNFRTAHAVEDLIANYYVLQVSPSAPIEKSEPLRVEIFDSSGQKAKHVSLTFPEKIEPCTTPANTGR